MPVERSAGGGGSGTVTSVTAGDTSIVIGGTAANPTVRTNTLDVIAADHPAAADWSNNTHKITALANGTAASDAAAFGQIPTVLPDGLPVGLGLKNWNFPPAACAAAGGTPTSQTVFVAGLWLPIGTTVTGIMLGVVVAGAGTSPTGFFVGLAKPNGTMVAQSNNLNASASLTTTGPQQFALNAQYLTTAADSATGFYYVVMLENGTFGTTQVTLGRNLGAAVPLGKAFSAGPIHVGTGATTGQTALPANGNPIVGGVVNTSASFWWVGAY